MHTETQPQELDTEPSPLPRLLRGSSGASAESAAYGPARAFASLAAAPRLPELTDAERCIKLLGIIGDLLITLRGVGERTRGDAVAATAISTATARTARQLARLGYDGPRS